MLKVYAVDLSKIKGTGDVECPRCGIKFSPDDETEKDYFIVKTVMKGNCLDKIVLQCNNCQSQIYLTGFHLLNKLR